MMMNYAPSRAFRIFLAVTLTLGLFVSAVGISISHSVVNADAAELVRHAELASADDHYHDHSHDDGELEEQRTGHNHGHNPSDHSHETPHLANHLYLVHRDTNRIQFVSIPENIELGASFRLDRPPKSVSLI